MNDAEAKTFLEGAFGTLFDYGSTEKDVLRYFTPDYQQNLNGKVYGFRDFYTGVSGLKAQSTSLKATFTTVVSGKDIIAEVHVLEVAKKDGTKLRLKIMAFQKLREGRICGVEELNSPL